MAASFCRTRNILQNIRSIHVKTSKHFVPTTPIRKAHFCGIPRTGTFRRLSRLLQANCNNSSQHNKWCYVTTVRFKSSINTLVEGESALPPEPTATSVGNGISSLTEPSFTSLGLAKDTPSGLVQSFLETLHVDFSLPWWGCLVVTAVVIRVLLIPLAVVGLQGKTQVFNHLKNVTELEQRLAKAEEEKDVPECERLAVQLNNYKVSTDYEKCKKRMLVAPLTQLPVFATVLLALRGMTNAPVESMKTGGLFWFTDLTIPDPFYILPVMTSFSFIVIFELETWLSKTQANPTQRSTRGFWLLFSVSMLPLAIKLPSALLFYWMTSTVYTAFQMACMQLPPIKRHIKPPPVVVQNPESSDSHRSTAALSDEALLQQLREKQRIVEEVNQRMMRKKSKGVQKSEQSRERSLEMDLTNKDEISKAQKNSEMDLTNKEETRTKLEMDLTNIDTERKR